MKDPAIRMCTWTLWKRYIIFDTMTLACETRLNFRVRYDQTLLFDTFKLPSQILVNADVTVRFFRVSRR